MKFLWYHRKIKDFHRYEIMSTEAAGIHKYVIRDVLFNADMEDMIKLALLLKIFTTIVQRTRGQESQKVMQGQF